MSCWNSNQAFPTKVSAADQPDRICYSNRAVYVSSCLFKGAMWSTIVYCCTLKHVYATFRYTYFFSVVYHYDLTTFTGLSYSSCADWADQFAHACCVTLVSPNGLTIQLKMLILSCVKVRWDAVKTVQYTYTDVFLGAEQFSEFGADCTLCCNEVFNRVCTNMSAPDVC